MDGNNLHLMHFVQKTQSVQKWSEFKNSSLEQP
jgi:hypothetical protein